MLTKIASFFTTLGMCLLLATACGNTPRACGTAGAPACDTDGAVTGDACGGFAGLACDMGEFCDYPPETSCGAGDHLGVCRAIPGICPGVVDPVCGCDQMMYSNACAAAAASVSVMHDGACP